MADLVMGAVPSIIAKLYELLKQEYKLQTDVKERISSLTDELESVQAALGKVAEVQWDQLDEKVQIWSRQVREASYDMEDVHDTFLVSVDGCRREPIDATGCWWLKRAKKKMGDLPTSKARARADIASNIEDIMKQLQDIAERCWRYRVDDILLRPVTSTTSTVDPRLPALYRNERELVGIEEARKELVTLLTEGDAEDDKKREVKEVCIVGLAGVGKTTLAKAVYNRLLQVEEQFEQFNCSAFVSVSRIPDLTKVFRDILLELDEPKYQTDITTKRMGKDRLIHEIREFLRDKRYLIVIDDIWDKHSWEAIKLALCDGGHGSRIITTTRKYDIAVRWANYYRLKPLSHDNSKNLFKKRIFGGEGNCPDTKLPGECDKILKKCGGLPLAIITVASVLASQPREKWSEVYNSVALTQQSNRYVDNMRRVLSFSFYDLPPRLRTCLLHLSIYPENCFIEKDFLIWKWVAEGFVDNSRDRHMGAFEIGEDYFHDLVNSSMIQIAQEGGVYGCRVHPVLLSHIRVISSEEDFCSVLDDEHHTSPGSSNSRRIVMHSIRNVERNIVPEVNMNMGKVRSFNASLCFIDGIPQPSRFQVLRVLALEYCLGIDTHHLKQIGSLVHLRYLGLVGAGVLDLPDEALGGLRFLQTLDMRETDIERWPRTISIQQLMCLCVRRITRLVPEDIGRLSSLEDLRLHHVSGDSVNMAMEMRSLQRLRVLEISFEKMDADLNIVLMESIGRLEGLRSLMLMAAANGEQEHHSITPPYLRRLNIFSTNMAVIFQGATMPKLEQIEFRVRVAQIADSRVGNLVSLSSLKKVTVVLDCRGASAAEMEEAEEMLGGAIAAHPNSPQLEVTKENGNNEVLLIDQFRFRNPRLEDLRSEMEKMQANQQVQVQPDNGSDEIVPAEVDSATS